MYESTVVTPPKLEQMPFMEIVVENTDQYTAYKISKTEIEGLFVFERRLYGPQEGDERGFYQEFARTEALAEVLGYEPNVKQWALSYNYPGALRGLHAEPQDKFITLIRGSIFVAIADIRPESKTFGKTVTFLIDQSNPLKPRRTLIVSKGLANSFMTLGDEPAEYFYAVTDTYKTSEGKRSIRWDDPDLNIEWPEGRKIISKADRENPSLRELYPDKFDR